MKYFITFILLVLLGLSFTLHQGNSPTNSAVWHINQSELDYLEEYLIHPEYIFDENFRNKVLERYEMVTAYEAYVLPELQSVLRFVVITYLMIFTLHLSLLYTLYLVIKTLVRKT
mgnify:CR=1 FL=1